MNLPCCVQKSLFPCHPLHLALTIFLSPASTVISESQEDKCDTDVPLRVELALQSLIFSAY